MIFIIIAITIYLIDRLIKNYIDKNKKLDKEEIKFFNKIIIRKHYNQGAALNFGEKNPKIILWISSIFLGFLVLCFFLLLSKKRKNICKIGMSFLIGGAFSNVGDRIEKGYVVDYFSFHTKKYKKLQQIIFNISDLFILLGGILTMIGSILEEKH